MDYYIVAKVVVSVLLFIGVLISVWAHLKQLSKNEDEKEQQAHKKGIKYYQSKQEALDMRSPGDRIYYDAYEKAYYIVAPVKKQFWKL
jgi:flagellar basal body-associated protein FliL